MELKDLKNKILSNVDIFDKLLRDNFQFENVEILHENKLDYNTIYTHEDFLSLTLHSCGEIEDFIFICFDKDRASSKELDFLGTKIYITQYINEMD